MMKIIGFCFMVVLLAIGFNALADDQYTKQKTTSTVKGNVTITAKTVDDATMMKNKMVKVAVEVNGVRLSQTGAHLHYQIDNSPVIVTHEPTLTFANLTPGPHKIIVSVVDMNHSPLTEPQTLDISIP